MVYLMTPPRLVRLTALQRLIFLASRVAYHRANYIANGEASSPRDAPSTVVIGVKRKTLARWWRGRSQRKPERLIWVGLRRRVRRTDAKNFNVSRSSHSLKARWTSEFSAAGVICTG